MIQMSFKRYEKKYLLSGEQYQEMIEKIAPYMAVDEYGQSTVCNIYYDTPQYDLIVRSLEKPAYKEKFRLRSYGAVDGDGLVFLEIKKKVDGIVYKRRIPLTLQEARESLKARTVIGEQAGSQIAREIGYFLQRYPLQASTYLAYDRIAMAGVRKGEEDIRITFDSRIRSRQDRMDLAQGDDGIFILPEEQAVMEIKVDTAYPFWLIHILEALEIAPASFSKYGTVYRTQIYPGLAAPAQKKLA